jgi:hypothetical protein
MPQHSDGVGEDNRSEPVTRISPVAVSLVRVHSTAFAGNMVVNVRSRC